jgi:site-specific DNA-methyltransferase (adenine-specific)
MSKFTVRVVKDSFVDMRKLTDGAYDVIITDPPYSAHVQSNLCSGSLVGTKNVPKYELPFEPLKDYAWLTDAIRIAKRWALSFCDLEAFGLIKGVCPNEYVRGGVWYKSNAMGQLTADRPATAYEGVAILHGLRGEAHPKKRWNGRGSYGIWRCNGTRGKKDRHPNEKPLDFCLKLVALFTERGETVFDPFCGSGAIGEACLRLGRNYVGWDNDPVWAGRTQTRLRAHGGRSFDDAYALGLCMMPRVKEMETAE